MSNAVAEDESGTDAEQSGVSYPPHTPKALIPTLYQPGHKKPGPGRPKGTKTMQRLLRKALHANKWEEARKLVDIMIGRAKAPDADGQAAAEFIFEAIDGSMKDAGPVSNLPQIIVFDTSERPDNPRVLPALPGREEVRTIEAKAVEAPKIEFDIQDEAGAPPSQPAR